MQRSSALYVGCAFMLPALYVCLLHVRFLTSDRKSTKIEMTVVTGASVTALQTCTLVEQASRTEIRKTSTYKHENRELADQLVGVRRGVTLRRLECVDLLFCEM